MTTRYFIVVPELWTRGYYVDADTPGEALKRIDKIDTAAGFTALETGEITEREPEFESSFDIGCWTVIESNSNVVDRICTEEAFQQYRVIPHTQPSTHEVEQNNKENSHAS